MKTKFFSLVSILLLVVFMCTAATCDTFKTYIKKNTFSLSTPESLVDNSISQAQKTDVINPAIKITDVFWNSSMEVIEVTLNEFAPWGDWKIYIDEKEIPMEGGAGKPVIRPNAELNENPTGLIIGTEPWVTGLKNVDFPVCGTLQFDIPGKGLTNIYQYNLTGSGCRTASKKNCQFAQEDHGVKTQTDITAASEKQTGNNQTEATSSNTNTQQGLSSDISVTDIYPDSQPKGIIWTRITNNGPETLKASKANIILTYTKKDLNGNTVENYTSNLIPVSLDIKPGETQDINLNIGFDNSNNSYDFKLSVIPIGFADPNSGNNIYNESLSSTHIVKEGIVVDYKPDVVISDLFPQSDWSISSLCIKVSNIGAAAIENKKIAITISGSQQDPFGNSSSFILKMERFLVDGSVGSEISLKPGETKVIYPKSADGGDLYFIYKTQYKYNFNLTVETVDFTDGNNNNNTYSKAIGKDKVIFSLINNTLAEIDRIDFIKMHIYPTGQKNKEINLQIPAGYGNSLKTGQTLYWFLDPGIYDMEILWSPTMDQSGYLGGGPFKVYSQYGVNITSDYNWVLDKAVVVLQAPKDYPIWGFFIAFNLSNNWSNNYLGEIIPRGEFGIFKMQPSICDWQVTTSNNEYYYWNTGRTFHGFTFIRIPEPSERDDPWRRYNP